jgi:8-oxo-dGTP pyrophosphatase MutT (NUDIX family)
MEQIYSLKKKLSGDLPGMKSHLKMAPEHREKELLSLKDTDFNPRLSAVLIILFHEEEQLKIVFIRRSEYVGIHSGQIAFPGGRYEDDDQNLLTTALREVEEEIGVNAGLIEILGQLSDLYVPPSNFLVRAFVGYTHVRPEYVIEEREVQEVLEFDFNAFQSGNIVRIRDFKAHNIERIIKAPCYEIDGTIIWGATAMILTELIDLFNE